MAFGTDTSADDLRQKESGIGIEQHYLLPLHKIHSHNQARWIVIQLRKAELLKTTNTSLCSVISYPPLPHMKEFWTLPEGKFISGPYLSLTAKMGNGIMKC